jgi:ribose transport system ATP-binding protein
VSEYLFEMRNIVKEFSGVRALNGVSLAVRPGECVGLCGENGAGKSTLMKILAGAHHPDSGEILLDGQAVTMDTPQKALGLGVSIIYQELNLVSHLSIADNIFLGREPRLLPGWIDQRKMVQQAQSQMDNLGMGLDVRRLVGPLTIAQRQMVEIAKATSRGARVIAMDEPSATLTDHELENLWRLIRQLTAQGVGIIYISHRMDEVFEVCQQITVLRDGRSVGGGPLAEMTREGILKLMVGREIDETFPQGSAVRGGPVLEVRGLSRPGVLHDINFTVHAGEVVALAGLVGAGRTEIARCIFGADRWSTGEMQIEGKPFHPRSPGDAIGAGIGFVTEDRKDQGVILPMTIRENISMASMNQVSTAGFIRAQAESAEARDTVTRLRVRTPSVEQRVGNLSGGNQQKVVLGKWLQIQPKLLILDEPTRGIDVGAKQEIYQIMNELTANGVAILMISSELPEVLGMADRIVVIREGRVAGELSRAEATQEKVGALALAG